MTYYVQLQGGVWLAPWRGEPGRTHIRALARNYKTRAGALGALRNARKFHPFPDATIEEVEP